MIIAKNLTKTIAGRLIVNDISLRAPNGMITGFLGPNGAGKTTTLRLLSGLLSPDTGCVEVDGIDVSTDPEEARSRLGILPDAKGLYRRLTARENMAYFGRLQGLANDVIRQNTEKLSAALGLDAFLDRRTEGFSQGERIRTALARALIHDPSTFMLDEPTNGLDVGSQRALRSFLLQSRLQGKAILLSTHALSDAASLCDRIVIISSGHVVAEGSPGELMGQAGVSSLEEAFVVIAGTDEGIVA